jgi:hypothetical protein
MAKNKALATFSDPPAIPVSSPPPVTSKPTSDLGASGSQIISDAGQLGSQLGRKPVGPVQTPPGAATGNVSTNPAGMAGSTPPAGMGPGTGLITKPGIMGETLAPPRGDHGFGFVGESMKGRS